MQLGTQLWLVNGGGIKGQLGYYGWVIATESHILWRGKGHSQGHPELIKFLCLESSGLLVSKDCIGATTA
eukprot:2337603-Ditylum_brightwellii.AAC.1